MSTYRIRNPKPGIYTTRCREADAERAYLSIAARARFDGYTTLAEERDVQCKPGIIDVTVTYQIPGRAVA